MQTSLRTLGIPTLMTFFVCVVYVPSSKGVSPDEEKVAKLQTDAERGTIKAELELAAHYVTGTGVPQDASLAARWYEQAARSGDADAQNQIGHFYQIGFGVPVDLARARNWYQLAATSGSTSGKLNLGALYLSGLGVPKDANVARQLFEEAANRGNGTAAAYLGVMYYLGLAGSPDMATAEKWFERGVKLHDPIAGYDLGSLLSVAPDHAHDIRKATNLLRDSARAGYVPSMHSLGLLLVGHPELEKVTNEGLTSVETAAGAGEWRSSIFLGILARDGRGGPVDRKSALLHFEIAVLQGGEEAEHMLRHDLEKLSSGLDADERASISSAAQAWYEQHPFAEKFIVKDPNVAKYFPLPSNTPQGAIYSAFSVSQQSR
ncbi:MAG TPA: tetratricopeptide repeat protein [Edaphobacter sp.]